MARQTTSVDSKVLERIRQHQQGPGTVFTPANFVDLGPRHAVDLALTSGIRGR